jgi:TolB-like protein
MAEPSYDVPSLEKAPARRLDSWKEIATYLSRDVTTVQRWEKREGMPVHRHLHDKRGSVYALTGELDAWVRSRRLPVEEPETRAEAPEPPIAEKVRPAQGAPRAGRWLALGALVCVCLGVAAWLVLRHRAAPVASSPVRSIAVLPFRNLSPDPGQEYLADGITEALIGRLSGIHDLRVTSYTSVMRFRDPQQSVPEIAKTLGVDAVVEGSVIREGSRIRVTAQLIRGATDEHFWSVTYDREMRDALTLESELAQLVAGKVEVTVTGEERQRLAAARPVEPEVYESYLKGQFAFTHGNGRADLEQSLHEFEDAIQKDSTFAPAYLGAAEVWSDLGTVFVGVPPQQTRPEVIRFARQALALDPDLVGAHVVLANVLQEEWQWSESESEYKRALDLNPNDAPANAGFAFWLSCQGRADEALTWVRRARALDPVGVSGDRVSWILFQAHRYDEAIRESRSVLAVEPDNAIALMDEGFSLVANNQAADAIPVLEKSISLSEGSPAATGVLIRAYAHAGRRTDALQLLAKLKQRRKTGYVPAGAFVNAYLGLGDKEQAFYWLEEAWREQSNILQFVKTHPYFDPIRSDPRFADLIHRVGLG